MALAHLAVHMGTFHPRHRTLAMDYIGAPVQSDRRGSSMASLNMLLVLCWLALVLCLGPVVAADTRKNVLLLIADDLRPQLDVYTDLGIGLETMPLMYTPNIDELASKSLVLGRAYAQVALCSPSRTSFLTGRRPDTTRVHDSTTFWRRAAGDFYSIPQYFKNEGYLSIGMGKVFHPGRRASDNDDPQSWTLNRFPYYHAESEGYWNMFRKKNSYRSYNTSFDYPLRDEEIATKAVDTLRQIAPEVVDDGSRFFMAVGFRLPHLPFIVPSRYLDVYPSNQVPQPENPDPPSNMPNVAWFTGSELRGYDDISELAWNGAERSNLPPRVVKNLRRHYYASVSYVDYQIGRVLKALEDLGMDKDTVVVLLGDHGYQLGEHGLWTKNTNFEVALQVPLIVHVPGRTSVRPAVSTRLVELVDLFPTLVELAGLPEIELCPENATVTRNTNVCREGSSFAGLVDDPNLPGAKGAAFSQIYRSPYQSMGYSVRTSRYRYTEWVRYNMETQEALWDQPLLGSELYDHMSDPQENTNLAKDKEMTTRILIKDLKDLLRAGWRSSRALPMSDWAKVRQGTSAGPSGTVPMRALLCLCSLASLLMQRTVSAA